MMFFLDSRMVRFESMLGACCKSDSKEVFAVTWVGKQANHFVSAMFWKPLRKTCGEAAPRGLAAPVP
jgi:hypothetical protein